MVNTTDKTTNQPIVHLENLSISHENGLLLTGVNLNLDEGDFVYLIGKSGVPKKKDKKKKGYLLV